MEINEETKGWALKNILKFEGTMGWPQGKIRIEAMVEELISMSPSIEAGDWMIKQLLRECDRCPTPADMRAVMKRRYKPGDELDEINR